MTVALNLISFIQSYFYTLVSPESSVKFATFYEHYFTSLPMVVY